MTNTFDLAVHVGNIEVLEHLMESAFSGNGAPDGIKRGIEKGGAEMVKVLLLMRILSRSRLRILENNAIFAAIISEDPAGLDVIAAFLDNPSVKSVDLGPKHLEKTYNYGIKDGGAGCP